MKSLVSLLERTIVFGLPTNPPFLLSIMLAGMASTGFGQTYKAIHPPKKTKIVGEIDKKQTRKADMATKETETTLASHEISKCKRIWGNKIPYFRELVQTTKLKKIPPSFSSLLSFKKEDCAQFVKAKEFNSGMVTGLLTHNHRIVVLEQKEKAYAKELRQVFKEACKKFSSKCESNITYLEFTNFLSFQTRVLHAFFHLRPSMIVGGSSKEETELLSKFSLKTGVVALVNSSLQDHLRNRFIFSLHPSEVHSATSLKTELNKRNLHKIAVLRPEGSSDSFIQKLRDYSTGDSVAVSITGDYIYDPNDIKSIKTTLEKLLQIDYQKRAAEFKILYDTAKEAAELQGETFNPNTISLPPILDFDAVFIPDHFKSIRHIAKIFQFFGVKSITLVGDYLWRNQLLINPWDPMISGSLFYDFIGNYKDLPSEIGLKIRGNGIFINPSRVMIVDKKLVAYAAGSIAGEILKSEPKNRINVSKNMTELKFQRSYFDAKPLFSESRTLRWPIHFIDVKNARLSISSKKPNSK